MSGYTVEDRRGPYRPNCGYCFDEGCTFCEGTAAQRLKQRLGDEEYTRLQSEADAFIVKHLCTTERDNVVTLAIPEGRDAWIAFIIEAFKYGEERARPQMVEIIVPLNQRFRILEIDS